MRDRVLVYALAASVAAHIAILCVVGRTSASRPIDPEELKLVRVEVVKQPEEVHAAPVDAPKPSPKAVEALDSRPIPPPERIPAAPPRPKPVIRPRDTRKPPPTKIPYTTNPHAVASSRLPGNPGGPINLGSGSPHGQDLGPSGRTPVGWVPGGPSGTGKGSGEGPGVGRPEPVPGAIEGPGREPGPAPPPPPPPDVDVRVCTESGMLPGAHCEHTAVRSYRPGSQPARTCTQCKPKHVSTLADRSVPELIGGQKRPKYPEAARDRGEEGSVTLEYTISTDGRVVGVRTTSSSGSSLLDRAAVETVQSRKYKPAVQGGIPRDYRKRETFHFTLD